MPQADHSPALLKLSGNALADDGASGFSQDSIDYIAAEVRAARLVCPRLAIVVGAGNILRGAAFRPHGPARLRADHAGMVATVVNALVLQDGLERAGLQAAVYSALPVGRVAEPFSSQLCRADMAEGRIVVLAGGTGNPLFTTDTAAALRAVQLGCGIMVKATRVDGVYSADPEQEAGAEFFERLSYGEVLSRSLGVMDLCAVSLCMEHGLPVRVLNYRTPGNIRRALAGEQIGTLIGT